MKNDDRPTTDPYLVMPNPLVTTLPPADGTRFEGPFGAVTLYRRTKGDRNHLAQSGRVLALVNTRPFALRWRIDERVRGDGLAATLLHEMFGDQHLGVFWECPADLDLESLTSTQKDRPVARPVAKLLTAIADALLGEINEDLGMAYAREVLAAPTQANGWVFAEARSRFSPPDWPDWDEARAAMLGRLEPFIACHPTTLYPAVDRVSRVCRDVQRAIPETIDMAVSHPGYPTEPRADFMLRDEACFEYVPRFTATSMLIETAGLLARVPVIAEPRKACPELFLAWNGLHVLREWGIACAPGLRLVDRRGATVALCPNILDDWDNDHSTFQPLDLVGTVAPSERSALDAMLRAAGTPRILAIAPVPITELPNFLASSDQLLGHIGLRAHDPEFHLPADLINGRVENRGGRGWSSTTHTIRRDVLRAHLLQELEAISTGTWGRRDRLSMLLDTLAEQGARAAADIHATCRSLGELEYDSQVLDRIREHLEVLAAVTGSARNGPR